MRTKGIGSLTVGAAAAFVSMFVSQGARAQEPTGPQSGGTGTASVGASATGTPTTANVATTPPKQTTAAAAAGEAKDDGVSDHEKMAGRFAVGYFGISQLPIGSCLPGAPTCPGGFQRDNVNAPVIGGRYWLNPDFGLDVGIGFGMAGGSIESVAGPTTTSVDKKSQFGLALHAGVPIALAHSKHFAWLLTPEATVGFTSGTLKGQPVQPGQAPGPNNADTDLSGVRVDIGARAGAEIHFGFIGIPELSLQGSVGLMFRREQYKAKQSFNGVDASVSDGTNTLGTTVYADPWALFVNNISAFYYF